MVDHKTHINENRLSWASPQMHKYYSYIHNDRHTQHGLLRKGNNTGKTICGTLSVHNVRDGQEHREENSLFGVG